jgi:hypothetical protein
MYADLCPIAMSNTTIHIFPMNAANNKLMASKYNSNQVAIEWRLLDKNIMTLATTIAKKETQLLGFDTLGTVGHWLRPMKTWIRQTAGEPCTLSWFLTRFKRKDAHGSGEHWHARDTRIYIGSGLCEDKNSTSCVRRCIMICWVETSSAHPFIG